MSEPITNYKDKTQGAILEIISGISALNMEPKPLKNPREDARFLSELDEWVQHSIEHFRAAIEILRK